jgi:deoxyribonuclease (pyrimidine dimer)
MTRINVLPPEVLSREHLIAEYHELPRVFTYVERHGVAGVRPANYCMGAGHVKFFTNKLLYLHNRYSRIYEEMLYRGYSVNKATYNKWDVYMHKIIDDSIVRQVCWTPSPSDCYTNMNRLVERGYND